MLFKEYYRRIPFLIFFLYSVFCWSQTTPPKILAEGNQAYCAPSMNVVSNFDIVNPDGTIIDALYIQISSGYISGEDKISLSNQANHPNIVKPPQWNVSEGKLTLESTRTGLDAQNDLIAAAKDVIFESSSPIVSGKKSFSFTIGDANYLPITDHYYQYVSDVGITWQEAKIAAENQTYYGRTGYLATITSAEEAKLSGEQAAGAGWIGGSDAETEGVWKWVTGPEAGTQFWNGGANGNTTAPDFFAFWNKSKRTSEPNNSGDEDYAHVTAPGVGIAGSWNDLSNTGNATGNYQPKGYIVEFGVPGDPSLDISASTEIYIPAIKSVSDNSSCGPSEILLSAELTDIAPSADILWFDSLNSNTWLHKGNTFETPLLLATTSYYVLASENSCTSGERILVTATVFEIPVIEQAVELKNCDEDGNPDGFTDFNLNQANDLISLGNTDLTISYHLTASEAATGANSVIPSPFNNAVSNTVYARAENSDGCFEIATVTLKVSTTDIPNDFMVDLNSCDLDGINDGIYTFDLTEASELILNQLPVQDLEVKYYKNVTDAQLQENEILPQENYRNTTPFSQTLFIRVESDDNGNCYGIGEHLTLTVDPLPEFEVEPNTVVCLNLPPVTLEVLNPVGQYTYIWTDSNNNEISYESTAIVSKGGLYKVVATSNLNCDSEPRIIEVLESVIADISMEDLIIVDNVENNSIAIIEDNLGIGDYEYALDNDFGPYQEEPLFEYVDSGLHTLYVRDKYKCGTSSIDVSVIGYPKFFTPNGDGINDTWQVDGVTAQPASHIYIYDKFGKLLKELDASGSGWDGFYNGKLLPSTDYWYMVRLEDGRIHKGHFSLITR